MGRVRNESASGFVIVSIVCLSNSISGIEAVVSITAINSPGSTFSFSLTYSDFIRPVIFVTSVTGGFTVVISIWAGIVSGYLINHERSINNINTNKIMVVPHLSIFFGG